MTVSSQLIKRTYQGNGITRTWNIDFPFVSADHVAVYRTDPNGAEEEVTNHYAVNLPEHTLTYPTEVSGKNPLPAGWKITLVRRTPLTQEINLLRQGELDAEVLEQGYDKLTYLVQELGEKVKRSIKYPVSCPETSQEADQFLAHLLSAQSAAQTACEQARESAEVSQEKAAQAQTLSQNAVEHLESTAAEKETALTTQHAALASALAMQVAAVKNSTAQAQYYAEHSIGKCMGEVYASQSSARADNPGSLGLWTGEFYQTASALYPDFYAWVKTHPELCTTREKYDDALSTTGECACYVVDETDGSLRLPKLSLIPVTPLEKTLYPWVVAYNSAVPASTVQAGQFAEELATKADQDLANLPAYIDYVVERRCDPETGSWLTRYKSGWCEQGGFLTAQNTLEDKVTFLRPFRDDQFFVELTSFGATAEYMWHGVVSRTANEVVFAHRFQAYWKAEGYLALQSPQE